ncbi:MAG: hypothetical protein IPO63_04780 [Bacteroidetes bacterium]|nr:hypothetical protein [Bacteroidota bacterium]
MFSALVRRWKKQARETGDQLVIASNGLKDKSRKYWMWCLGATFVSPTACYSIVNCILHAFHGTNCAKMILYCLGNKSSWASSFLLSPTPGGSGLTNLCSPIF